MADHDSKRPGRIRLHRGKPDSDSAIIASLILGGSQQQAADHARVSLKTVARRLKSASFLRRLAEARREVIRQSVDKAASFGNMALGTLLRLMNSQNDAIALGAARSLAEIAFRMREIGSFEERLAALEDQRSDGDGLELIA